MQVDVVGQTEGLVFVLDEFGEFSEELFVLQAGEQRVLFGFEGAVRFEVQLGVAEGQADVFEDLRVDERSFSLGFEDEVFEVADEGFLRERRAPSCWGCPR